MNNFEIGTRIKKLRESKNMSQDELSKKINMSRSTISYVEQGKRCIDLSEIIEICKVFDISVEAFIDDSKETLYLTQKLHQLSIIWKNKLEVFENEYSFLKKHEFNIESLSKQNEIVVLKRCILELGVVE